MVLAASENPYGDTGGFCAIPRAKNIYARGMGMDKYVTKINLGKYIKRMYYDLTKGKISKNLILFALPMMAAINKAQMSVVLTVISLGLRVVLAYILSVPLKASGIWVAIVNHKNLKEI